MDIVLSFSALCILLVVGKLLRVEIRLFQKLYLPASVIGGLIGLVLVQTIGGSLPAATMAGWNQLPGFLINIVFSALFWESSFHQSDASGGSPGRSWRTARLSPGASTSSASWWRSCC